VVRGLGRLEFGHWQAAWLGTAAAEGTPGRYFTNLMAARMTPVAAIIKPPNLIVIRSSSSRMSARTAAISARKSVFVANSSRGFGEGGLGLFGGEPDFLQARGEFQRVERNGSGRGFSWSDAALPRPERPRHPPAPMVVSTVRRSCAGLTGRGGAWARPATLVMAAAGRVRRQS
jgi:hypothetical protein